MIKVHSMGVNEINANDMKDGDVAIITSHGVQGYVGRIVQRCSMTLVTIGESSDCSWPNFFNSTIPAVDFNVRILPKGTTLKII